MDEQGKDELFDEIFIRGNNVFPFLFPAQDKTTAQRLAPMVISACKRQKAEHGLTSMLPALIEVQKEEKYEKCQKRVERRGKKEGCGNDLKPFTGYLPQPQKGQTGEESLPFVRSLMNHTRIHPQTRTAAPGAFFRELILIPQPVEYPHFTGEGTLSEPTYAKLKDIFAQDKELLMGKSSSRGMGWGKLELAEITDDPPQKSASSYRCWKYQNKEEKEKEYITLTCLTPMILLDDYLNPVHLPILSWNDKEMFFVAATSRIIPIRGWSVVHGLPKHEDIAIDIGSVFVYNKPDNMNDDTLKKWAIELEKTGMGERRIEGFGEIRINDPILENPEGQ